MEKHKRVLGFGIAILVLFGAAWTWQYFYMPPVPRDFEVREQHVTIFVQGGGKDPFEASFAPGSKVLELVDQILKSCKGKWARSYHTYAHVIYVRGSTFSVNFQTNLAIVNYQDSFGRWSQVVSDISPESFIGLEHAIKNSKQL